MKDDLMALVAKIAELSAKVALDMITKEQFETEALAKVNEFLTKWEPQ